MSDIKLKAASGGGSISLKGPSSAGSDTDFLDTSGNLKVTGDTTVDGKILLGTTSAGLAATADNLTVNDASGHSGITLRSPSSHNGNLFFADGTSGVASYAGYVQYSHTNDQLILGSAGNDRITMDNSGDITISNGNLKVASGHGIDFSANSHAGGMTSEMLDSYEEGTFTPIVHGWSASGTATYNTQTGSYIKVGKQVTVWVNLDWSEMSNASGVMAVGGLPFAHTSDTYAGSCWIHTGNMGDDVVSGLLGNGQSSSILLYMPTTGAQTHMTIDTNGGYMKFTCTYIASA